MDTTEKITATDKIGNLINTGSSPLWGEKERGFAFSSFLKQAIPNRKSEEYKYVNVEAILKNDFVLAADKSLSKIKIAAAKIICDAYFIVLVNGKFDATLSEIANLPKGLSIMSLADAAKSNNTVFEKYFSKYADVNSDVFIAMNTAAATDGAFIHISKSAVIEKPIHIIHVSSANENTLSNTHSSVIIEENANAKFIESFVSIDNTAKSFSNNLIEIAVEQHANIEWHKVQYENESSYLINTTQVKQAQQSVFTINTIILDGALVRNNLNIVLDGQNIESHLNGLYLTHSNQVVDNHTLVDHQKPNCNSNELYKGIINDKSSATFNGKIYVRKDAQKTNAFQSNKNILLSDDGTINTKPQLEIYADDVKCSHGTSTGKLDEDKIFYLRARGLSETSAKKLLMHAFASEVVDFISIEELRNFVKEKISEQLK